ncbi:unnamed protein product [Zymoseptoria tritici ST99CH_1E4]|uniref:Uncharacterized protein n=1 Tax=Zymoseptoria tritici ST99CH_1E4 TaxID=1276532 RepID=A0A2H1GSS2_ZYMTR|nr:unnamed protein product [Zymoseptoria tritici ST99CH_1E4]
MPAKTSKTYTLVKHGSRVKTPLEKGGPVTFCDSRAEVVGYLGINRTDDSVTKQDVLRLVGHPIIIKGFVDFQDIHARFPAHPAKTTFALMLSFLWDVCGCFAASNHQWVVKYVGTDMKDAAKRWKGHPDERIRLLSASLWHSAQRLKRLGVWDLDAANVEAAFDRFDTLMDKDRLPEEYRHTEITEWPIGLRHDELEGLGEQLPELLNRLWQLFWLMRQEIFQPRKNKEEWLNEPKHKPTQITKKSPSAHSPLWWDTAKTSVGGGAKALSREAQMATEFGKKYFRSPQLLPVDCYLVVEKPERWAFHVQGFSELDTVLPDFPVDGTLVGHPILSTPHLKEWRNSLRKLLEVEAYILSIHSISLVTITEDEENASKEIFNYKSAEIPRSEVTNFFVEHQNASKVQVVVEIKINQVDGDQMEDVPTTVPYNNGHVAYEDNNNYVFNPMADLRGFAPVKRLSPTAAALTFPPA